MVPEKGLWRAKPGRSMPAVVPMECCRRVPRARVLVLAWGIMVVASGGSADQGARGGGGAATLSGSSNLEVHVEGDALTLRADGAPLDEVVRRIAEESGARLEGRLERAGTVSADYRRIPLREGLERLLDDQNFMLAYRPDGRLSRLVLMGEPRETRVAVVPATVPEPVEEEDDGGDGGNVFQRRIRLAPGPTRQHFGRERATLQELLDVAFRSTDRALRDDAMRTALRAIDEKPDINAAVSALLAGANEDTLATSIKAMAGEHAREAVAQFISLSRTAALRDIGVRVMQRLVAASE